MRNKFKGNKLKLLCLTDAFWPDHAGGISKTVYFETEGLKSQGHEIVAIGRRINKSHPLKEGRNGYDLFRYPAPTMGSRLGLAYPLATLINLPRLIRNLSREHGFDVAYVNNVFQAAALLISGRDIPMVYVFHASAYREISLDLQQGKYGKLSILARTTNRFVRLIENWVLKRADAIIVRSEFMLQELHSLYGSPKRATIYRIPLGIDTELFSFAKNSERARARLGLSEKTGPILLTVRRLVARTGVENLILAMRQVVKEFPTANLLIAGRGYLERKLSALVRAEGLEKNIILLGFVAEELLPLYYQAADLFILPTQAYEGFGLSTLESLASGTPVLATSVGANSEVLGPLDPNLVIQGVEADAIANAIIQWLSCKSSDDWRLRSRNYCVDNFARDAVCKEIESVLHKVART